MAAAPPSTLQLLAHPVRWRLLADLSASDRTVQELTALAEEPQNLVSYHLGKLRHGGLVRARRSSADGRGAYYAADLGAIRDQLREAALRLHPGLLPGVPGPGSAFAPGTRVLFLCTGNSARSQIAEALLRHRTGGRVEAHSAGSAPKPIHPNAVRVLREGHGIDISARRSQHLDAVADLRFDRVVTLCDKVREVCPALPGGPVATHWSTPDPAAGGHDDDTSYPAFVELAADLDRRLGFLLATLAPTEEP